MKGNIHDLIPDTLPEEITNILYLANNIRIERIISSGQYSPEDFWYDQEENEWVMLLEGSATIAFDDATEINLQKGDYMLVPRHKKHRVAFTSQNPKCIWLAIFFTDEINHSSI